jgi:actin-related protein
MDGSEQMVLDDGGSATRFGWGGDDAPRRVLDATDCGLARQRMAIERRAVTHWCDMEQTWATVFNDFGCDHAVLSSEPIFCPRANRERAAELLFETFRVPAWAAAPQAELALYAAGADTGAVLDVGDGCAHAAVIVDGRFVTSKRLDLAGRDVTALLAAGLGQLDATPALQPLLNSHGYAPTATAAALKQRFAFVCPVAHGSERPDKRKAVMDGLAAVGDLLDLPDGTTIRVSADAVLHSGVDTCVEALFRPEIAGLAAHGVAQLVADALESYATTADFSQSHYSCQWNNVTISGGSTLCRGFKERLEAELLQLVPPDAHKPDFRGQRARVIAMPDREYSAWLGGSILACMPAFLSTTVTKQRYEDEGASALAVFDTAARY